jgi:hypothetical protein
VAHDKVALAAALRDRVAGDLPCTDSDGRPGEGDVPTAVLGFDDDRATTEQHVVNVTTASRVRAVRDDGRTVRLPPLFKGACDTTFGITADSRASCSGFVGGASDLPEGNT